MLKRKKDEIIKDELNPETENNEIIKQNEKKDDVLEGNKEIEIDENSPKIVFDVEQERKKFVKLTKIFKYLNIALMIFMVSFLIVIYTVIMPLKDQNDYNYGAYLALGLGIGVLAFVFIYLFIVKKYTQRKYKEYFCEYNKIVNNYTFKDDEFSELNINIEDKINEQVISSACLFKNIAKIGSRYLITFKYKYLDNFYNVTLGDAGIQTPLPKGFKSVFTGKLFILENNVDLPGKLLIQIKGKNSLVSDIDNTDGLENYISRNNLNIYSNLYKIKQIITNKVLSLLESFKLDDDLLDVVVSIYDKKVIVGLDYNDSVMFLERGIDKPIDYKIIDRTILDNKIVLELLCELNEKIVKLYNEDETK